MKYLELLAPRLIYLLAGGLSSVPLIGDHSDALAAGVVAAALVAADGVSTLLRRRALKRLNANG